MCAPIELDRICIVLVSTRNPLNIGAAARALCNFGFARLRVVHPYDAAFREARSAVGAHTLLENAEEFDNVGDAVADCTLVVGTAMVGRRQFQLPLKTLAEGAPLLREHVRSDREPMRRVAILFGSEKFGLTNEDLSHCHWVLHIPTDAAQPSMNLGQAVAVCLYELIRNEDGAAHAEPPQPASAGEMERMAAVLLEALHASGYLGENASPEKEQAVRRQLYRLALSREDASLWLGMLRQIAWRLRTKD